MDSRFSRTGPATQKSLSGCVRNSGGSFFGLVCFVLFLIWGLLILLWEKRQLSKHCHQQCLWELEDLSFSSELLCKLITLHPKWITSCASWLLSVHLDLLTTFLLLDHQPTDLVPGFLLMVIPATLLLKKASFQWTLWPKRHSSIMMWPLPPLLSCCTQSQHSPL